MGFHTEMLESTRTVTTLGNFLLNPGLLYAFPDRTVQSLYGNHLPVAYLSHR
jgi:hypothetical protein